MESPAIARRQITFFLYAFLFVVVYGVSMLVPPMQSPDELDHLQRSYLLSHGQIFLETPAGESSGGKVDTGLIGYLVNYATLAGKPEARLSSDLQRRGEAAQWSGERGFSILPGTGYYFPAIYAPQALALAIGEHLNFSIDTSYRMARFFALVAAMGLLIAAFKIYRPSPLALIVLVLPMTIFQMTASTIDGLSVALAFFAVSCFKRDMEAKGSDHKTFVMLAASIFLLVTCRAYMVPMVLMLIAPAVLYRSKKRMFVSVAATVAAIAWIALAMAHTVDLRFAGKVSSGEIAKHYLTDPVALWNVVYSTLSNADLTSMYWQSFIGKLGWLDTTIPMPIYVAITSLIALAILINVRASTFKQSSSIILLTCGVASIVLVFVAMLVTWTPHPAQVILGVQGRYFAIPAILVLYAIGTKFDFSQWFPTYIIVSAIFLVSASSMIPTLANRYYLSNAGVVSAAPLPPESKPGRKPSSPLPVNGKLIVTLPQDHSFSRIGVLFGTYQRVNEGNAVLLLSGEDGVDKRVVFKLSGLADNKYHFFDVAPGRYKSAEIQSEGNGGVSVWEYDSGRGRVSCVILEGPDKSRYTVPGCPE